MRGELLNGAIIAGSEDNSSIYYNPAAITSSSENSRFSLSGFTGSYELYNHINGAGEGTDLNFGKFEVVPDAIAISFRPFEKNKNIVSYFGVFKRNFYNFEISTSLEDEGDYVSSQLGNEFLSSTFQYEDKLKEAWLNMGLSYEFKKNISLGGGLVMAFANRNYRFAWSKSIFDSELKQKTLAYIIEDLSFTHSTKINMHVKAGLAWEKKGCKLGIIISSPTFLRALDDGHINYTLRQNVPADSNTLIIDEVHPSLRGNYRNPFSIGAGIEIPIKNTRLSFSTEYFHHQKTYNLLSPIDDINNPHIYISNHTDWVVNGAIGIHINFKKEIIDLLGGIRTDISSKRNQIPTNDIFELKTVHNSRLHFSLGTLFNLKKNTFSFGIDYGFSPFKTDRSIMNLAYVDLDNFKDISSSVESDIRYSNFTFLFGYEFLKK